MHRTRALHGLLLSLFSADELRRFIRYGPDGDAIAAELPGASASPAALAEAVVTALDARGLDDEFFARVLAERPRRVADVNKVRDAWAHATPADPTRPATSGRPVVGAPARSRFVVLTALEVEARAVLEQLADLREQVLLSGTIIDIGDLHGDDKIVEVAVAQGGAGNVSAAALSTELLGNLRPAALLFVGVAGGIKDVAIGDVVAATKVYGYTSGKAGGEFLARPDVGRSAYRFEQRARADARRGAWLKRRKGEPTGEPTAYVGPIAAGEAVVASKRSPIFSFLREHYSDALAVEMEGRGLLEAAWMQHVEAMVIRGISDCIDGKSKADASGSQKLAARNAAAFAAEVMLNVQFGET